jgi:hypothetical protein
MASVYPKTFVKARILLRFISRDAYSKESNIFIMALCYKMMHLQRLLWVCFAEKGIKCDQPRFSILLYSNYMFMLLSIVELTAAKF